MLFLISLLLASLFSPARSVPVCGSVRFDSSPVWPLCGRRAQLDNGVPVCNWNTSWHDGPIASTFGPRLKVSQNKRYDFHRGIDIPCDVGTPLFAVAVGEVVKAGVHSSYLDPVIQIRHKRPNCNSCATDGLYGGCYHSNYLHVLSANVSVGETVNKGQFVGFSGVPSDSTFEHLHFEIREASDEDPFSAWSRNCIHPLSFLPYPDLTGEPSPGFNFTNLVLENGFSSSPTFSFTFKNHFQDAQEGKQVQLDLAGFRVELTADGVLVQQPGDLTSVSKTIEGDGYWVYPSVWDAALWNRLWSYKNSNSFPWSSFQCNGTLESPYCDELENISYSSDVHLDKQGPYIQEGCFNGWCFLPSLNNAYSTERTIEVRLTNLTGPTNGPIEVCIKVQAWDVRGRNSTWFETCQKKNSTDELTNSDTVTSSHQTNLPTTTIATNPQTTAISLETSIGVQTEQSTEPLDSAACSFYCFLSSFVWIFPTLNVFFFVLKK